MSLLVTFWGVRGSIAKPGTDTRRYGGNTACVEIKAGDIPFIVDAGTGIDALGQALCKNADGPISIHLFLSHAHWDHIQGFPFFAPAYLPDTEIVVHGPEESNKEYVGLLSGQMTSHYFPVDFSQLNAKISSGSIPENGARILDVQVQYLKQIHPGGSYAYSFEAFGKKVVYATDTEVDAVFKGERCAFDVNADPDSLRPIPEEFVHFAMGADLFIVDSQYFDDEYETRVGWGHSRATTVVDWAIKSGVKRLALFHHDPQHDDDLVDEKVFICQERAKNLGSQMGVFGARENLTLRIA